MPNPMTLAWLLTFHTSSLSLQPISSYWVTHSWNPIQFHFLFLDLHYFFRSWLIHCFEFYQPSKWMYPNLYYFFLPFTNEYIICALCVDLTGFQHSFGTDMFYILIFFSLHRIMPVNVLLSGIGARINYFRLLSQGWKCSEMLSL